MLEKLTIKNYLLLKNIEIDLSNGFNIITGETGAGKSILINALNLLLGGRADYSIISKNKDKMIIEGIVSVSKENAKAIGGILKEHEIESMITSPPSPNVDPAKQKSGTAKNAEGEGGESSKINKDEGLVLIIRRELYTKAYSRCFINDTPVGTNELKELGEVIIDIHSQNEHQSLLKKEVHIELVDSYLIKKEGKKFEDKLNSYKQGYEQLLIKQSEFDEINKKKSELDNKRSFIDFQLKEIHETNPLAGEDDELENELKTGENIEGIRESLTLAYANLYDDTGSVLERIKIVEKELGKIGEYNTDIQKILGDVSESTTALREASRLIESLLENLNFDPARVEEIRERLYKLQFLKKKYGGSIDEVIKLKETLEKDLSLVDNFDETIKKLKAEIDELVKDLFQKAGELSKTRKDKSKQLEVEIVKILKEVGFENAEFKTNIENTEAKKLNSNGYDDVEFMVKINKGDEFSSLRKTASGGEVSRIMLAVKSVLAGADKVDILVFDEIDTGISGRIAQKVGRVMKGLSGFRQVIAITHLAQIAALADEHLLVEKETEGNSTITRIRPLDKNEKVIEVAKLLSGEKVTDASIKSAKELMSV
ncbi:MAG TPA: DNA repair protein RecN [Ignavibacteria bacterium]|nr:DNA repair protein RecN [Ignavibacteria bacterium]HMQ97633.1 DNA repair protein RecN [Ignavibacteria bacterium]